jgi:hypothetical protein
VGRCCVFEAQPALLGQLKDHGGDERLGDAGYPELGVDGHRRSGVAQAGPAGGEGEAVAGGIHGQDRRGHTGTVAPPLEHLRQFRVGGQCGVGPDAVRETGEGRDERGRDGGGQQGAPDGGHESAPIR